MIISNDKVLTLEQVNSLLSYCIDNNDTIFSNYYISKDEENYQINKLSENQVVAYTDDQGLLSFMEKYCNNIKLLPSEFSIYNTASGILSEEQLLIYILDCFNSIDEYLLPLLPIYRNTISSVKKVFIEKISFIKLNNNTLTKENDLNIQCLEVANSIEKIDNKFYETLRKKILVVVDDQNTKLTDVSLQHTVEIGNIKFPLSKLLPNDDQLARIVDNIKELISDLISPIFADKLFGEEIDNNRASSVYEELNKYNVTLDNGAQLAFILTYASSKNIVKGIRCKVYDDSTTPVARDVCEYWLIHGQSFIDSSHILNKKYEDTSRYLTIPYSIKNTSCTIKENTVDYQCIKLKLNESETRCLLDYLFAKYVNGSFLSSDNLNTIKGCIGLTNKYYVLSSLFSLEDERVPVSILNWIETDRSDDKKVFLQQQFEFIGEDSDIVEVRKYLQNEISHIEASLSVTTSRLTCAWIENKKLILTDSQYSILQDILEDDDYEKVIDYEKLEKQICLSSPYLSFGDYSLYLYPSPIPWNARIKDSKYTFHAFLEGDITIKGYSIFVNEACESDLRDQIKSIINSESFTADDFVKFLDAYQSMLSGTLDGENDEDLDDDARGAANQLARDEAINWLSARGYDTINVKNEYSILKGVKKGPVNYHIVVKSFRSKKRELKINPNEWLELVKENARLMIYLGHMSFAVIDRHVLLGNHDFLRLRISAQNFSIDNGKLDYTIRQLAENIRMFERTHFVFEHINDSILTNAESLESYGLFQSNSTEEFTAGSEDDI